MLKLYINIIKDFRLLLSLQSSYWKISKRKKYIENGKRIASETKIMVKILGRNVNARQAAASS